MARKNIFQLIEENYDVSNETRKINDLFSKGLYFVYKGNDYSLRDIVTGFLFDDWNCKGTCITIDEFLRRAEATITTYKPAERVIINFLEVMENFVKLYFDNSKVLYDEQGIKYYSEFNTEFCFLINTLEKRMGLTSREYKERIIIYPKHAPLEKVVDLCEDEDVQWELIRYVREELSLSEKRKSLAYLATNLNIEDDKNEKDEHIKALVKKAGNVLNNLHIRHNNKTGKWESEVFKGLTQKEAMSLCDMVYNEMLTIVLLREHKEYDELYEDFNKKQKEAANTNKS